MVIFVPDRAAVFAHVAVAFIKAGGVCDIAGEIDHVYAPRGRGLGYQAHAGDPGDQHASGDYGDDEKLGQVGHIHVLPCLTFTHKIIYHIQVVNDKCV